MANNIYDPRHPGPQITTPGGGTQGSIPTSDISRILPRQLSTGFMRGTQGVGSAGAKIDASNNRISVGTPDGGSLGFGSIPGTTNEFGFFSVDASGNLIFKIVGATFYIYDGTTHKNIIQMGKLPDSTYNFANAASGYNVADGFV